MTGVSPRLTFRRAFIGAGVLLAIAVPLLLFFAPKHSASPDQRAAGQGQAATVPSTPPPAAAPAPPATKPPATKPPAAGAAPATTTKGADEDPTLHDLAARSRRRLETTQAELHQQFDCKPVRKDESASADQYPVPNPPFTEGIFPCTRCHDRPDDHNETKRTLTLQHTDIKLVHGPREQWCYGCHNPTNRDMLRLAGGRLISFDDSYELCGQCHGPKLRDWRLGIHGRRVGCWNGKRQYLLCVNCHSPHAPHFPKLQPKPRPKKPTEIHARGDR